MSMQYLLEKRPNKRVEAG